MILFGQFNGELSDPEALVGSLGVAAIFCIVLWALIRWILGGAANPDPWDEQVAAEIDAEDCTPLCHHCLSPHDLLADFCPNCGAAVGTCTNLLPFPYLFSIGQTLRIGTSESIKRSPLTIVGFFLFSLAQYSVFAPIYWFMFVKNLQQSERRPTTEGPQVAES